MWKLSPSERVVHWKNFRKSLDLMSADAAVLAVAEFWQSCPYVAYYLDPDTPDHWPTPWELISENYYCDLAKSLGMLYTIYFTVHGRNLDPEIRVYYDPNTEFTYNLPILAQGKYVINLVDNTVVNIESIKEKLVLVRSYNRVELKLQEN
jgi:hypothetical protein